jgi:hypothetical protein
VADFTERLDQIVGGLAVVFDDQQAHLRGSCGHWEHAFSHHGAVALHMQGDRPFSMERDDFSSKSPPTLSSCLIMIFSENRLRLFRIMLSSEKSGR